MKKILIFLIFAGLLVSLAGCHTSSSDASVLIGNWAWVQQRTSPSPATNTGAMNVQSASGSNFSGLITWATPNPGGPYIFSGTLTGTSISISYAYGGTTETWTLNLLGNNLSGNWSADNGNSGTMTGNKVS